MTTAKFEYSVQHIGFCIPSIIFFGQSAQVFNDKWREIKQDYMTEDELQSYEKTVSEFLDNDKRNDDLKREYNSLRRWYRPWDNKRQREIVRKMEQIYERMWVLSDALNNIYIKKFDAAHERLLKNTKHMLKDNGFVMINYSKDNNGQVVEIWATKD